MNCGDSGHFAASCPRKFKVVSGHMEINPFRDDKGKGKEQEEESGNF
jgi:hypothetical protein